MLDDLVEMVCLGFDRKVETPIAIHAALPKIDALTVLLRI
jgi:hypothetical protein